jgi:hypothetical protein
MDREDVQPGLVGQRPERDRVLRHPVLGHHDLDAVVAGFRGEFEGAPGAGGVDAGGAHAMADHQRKHMLAV